ncbi:hypothetical protein LTR65_009245 [Meristemomyces frigidus]
MTNTLDTIPPELLASVFGFLEDQGPYHGRLGAFYTLSLTSRAMRNAATPYLYKTFQQGLHSRTMGRFVRSLCHNPELAKHVRSIDIHPNQLKPDSSPTPADAQLFTDAASALKELSCHDEICSALQRGCYSALALLLVSLTTKLASLHLGSLFSEEVIDGLFQQTETGVVVIQDKLCTCCANISIWYLWIEVIFGTLHLRNRYQRLTEAHVVGTGILGLGAARALLHLPSLQKMTCENFGTITAPFDWGEATADSNLTALHIEGGYLSVNDVAGMAKSCKGLRELSVEWDAEAVIEDDWVEAPSIDVSSVLEVIHDYVATLETLVLVDLADEGRIFSSRASNIHDFIALRTLEVDESVLVGGTTWGLVELHFPPNLVSLVVHTNGMLEDLAAVSFALYRARCEVLDNVRITFPIEPGKNDGWTEFRGVCSVTPEDHIIHRPQTMRWKFGMDVTYDGESLEVWCHGKSVWVEMGSWGTGLTERGLGWLFDHTCDSTQMGRCSYPLMW